MGQCRLLLHQLRAIGTPLTLRGDVNYRWAIILRRALKTGMSVFGVHGSKLRGIGNGEPYSPSRPSAVFLRNQTTDSK